MTLRSTPAAARIVVALLGVALLATLPAAPAVSAPSTAYVQPALLADAARTLVPAVVAWDGDVASGAEVVAHLERAGLRPTVLERLDMAVVCGGDVDAVRAMAAAPGAISVWGEEGLIPTLDESVPTAFAGDPNTTWSFATGAGVGLAVIDTGIDASHPDLATGTRTKSNIRVAISHREILGSGDPPPCRDFYSPEMVDTEVTSGHGTHMASVAAGDGSASGGRLKGMAPAADLVGIGMSDTLTPSGELPEGQRFSMLGALAAINYVLSYHLENPPIVKVALLGWAGEGLYDPYHPIAMAIRDLAAYDITPVVPVGNEGPAVSDCSDAATCHFNPFAVGAHVLAVGATPKRARATLSSFSSRGDPTTREVREEVVTYQPTVVAPGVNVMAARRAGTASFATVPGSLQQGGGSVLSDQTNPRYVALSGTSVAAAHVAGAVAVLQQVARDRTGCYLRNSQVLDVIRNTATWMAGYDAWETGAGALNAGMAALLAGGYARNTSPDPWVCPR